jgi:hypothetical protein
LRKIKLQHHITQRNTLHGHRFTHGVGQADTDDIVADDRFEVVLNCCHTDIADTGEHHRQQDEHAEAGAEPGANAGKKMFHGGAPGAPVASAPLKTWMK